MHRSSILLFALTILSVSACNRCMHPEYVSRLPLMEQYFGHYKPGAWWVYLNRDHSKRDSIYVCNFTSGRTEDKEDQCLAQDVFEFDLHTDMLAGGDTLHGVCAAGGSGFSINWLQLNTIPGDQSYAYIQAKKDTDSLCCSGIRTVLNYPLWPGQPATVLPVATIWNNMVVAPNYGIVQYSPLNTTDTFTLINSYRP